MTGRTPCCVPFCRRTTKAEHGFDEWICGPHWKMVPKSLKARRRLANRLARRTRGMFDRIHPLPDNWHQLPLWRRYKRLRWISGRAWERCKEAAIAAGGITP